MRTCLLALQDPSPGSFPDAPPTDPGPSPKPLLLQAPPPTPALRVFLSSLSVRGASVPRPGLTPQPLPPQGAHLAVIDALMVAFAFEWTKTLPGPLALASLEHKLLFWVDTVGGVRLLWAGGRGGPVTGALVTSPCSPDHPAAAGEDRAGSCPESLSCGPCRWGGPSTALGEARAMNGWTDRRTVGGLGGRGRAALRGHSCTGRGGLR